MFTTVTLVIVLSLLGHDKPIIHQEQMASVLECVAAVREIAGRAADELKAGGQLQVGCVVTVPKSENP